MYPYYLQDKAVEYTVNYVMEDEDGNEVAVADPTKGIGQEGDIIETKG